MSDDIREIERETERARARLDISLESLQQRLTVSGLADEALGAVRRSEYGQLFDDTVQAVRRNPLPLVLAGAAVGLFLIQLGEERTSSSRAVHRGRRPKRGVDPNPSPVDRMPEEPHLNGLNPAASHHQYTS